ncbi:unnamed protein product [Triticum turgidum subsp. durum]|uniref:Transaldolase n=1 Tax=Triticum turgidum subsp. durum TaxID=4567 RepID=A0A9R0ZFJ3_TRITD|nr:unnamed protein product [Triticum turgidum subsp. durum]
MALSTDFTSASRPGLFIRLAFQEGSRPAIPSTRGCSWAAVGRPTVKKAYVYIHKNGYKTKLMAAAVRNKQDVFSLLGIDYIIAPLKILQSLDESVTDSDEKYGYVQRLTPSLDKMYNFSQEELVKWDQLSLAAAMGPAAEELLASGLEGYANQARRVEELFVKIWPPPNV